MGNLYVGTSGFTYKDWGRGVFYPKECSSAKWFDFYDTQFSVLEVNVTFYRLVSPKLLKSWYERSGDDFRFVIKGSRYLTHIHRLKTPAAGLKRFFRTLKPLKEKLAATLWQLP